MSGNDFEVFKANQYSFQGVVFHPLKRPNMRAEIAIKLAEHFAIVAGQEDGEDSAGRRAFKLQSPDQVVARACGIADGLVNEFESRGWIVDVPAYNDIGVLEKTK